MDLDRARTDLETRLAPAADALSQRRARAGWHYGLAGGTRMLPRLAAVLALGFLGGSYVLAEPPFSAWLLPVFLVLVPLAAALSFFLQLRRDGLDSYETALVLDRNNHTGDRLSTALEFAGDARRTAGSERSAALARAAVEDGVRAAASVDLTRTEADFPERRISWASAGLALIIALAPAVLGLASSANGPTAEPDDSVAQADTGGDEVRGDDAGSSDAADPSADDETTPSRELAAPAREPEPRDEPREEPREPEQPEEPPPSERRSAGGAGAGESAPSESGSRTAPKSEAAESAAQGAASSAGAGGGGQGASQSENPPEPDEKKQEPKSQNNKPAARPSETKPGEPEKSSGTPSGPSRGGGQMTSVANERSGLDRGVERDDDAETDDEEVEDEREESEQRGGVMPMTRDRMQPPSRELSISGNGPPDDGRGGPTPPKKSRGTASLVLGIRLPDQVRGQPNPGTAKTTLEQVPPVPQDAAARATAAATSDGPSPNPQSASPAASTLAEVVRRYHASLRGSPPAEQAADDDTPRPGESNR